MAAGRVSRRFGIYDEDKAPCVDEFRFGWTQPAEYKSLLEYLVLAGILVFGSAITVTEPFEGRVPL